MTSSLHPQDLFLQRGLYCESEKLHIKKNKFKGRILGVAKDGVLKWYPNRQQAEKSAGEVFKNVVWCSDCGEISQVSQYRPLYKNKSQGCNEEVAGTNRNQTVAQFSFVLLPLFSPAPRAAPIAIPNAIHTGSFVAEKIPAPIAVPIATVTPIFGLFFIF